MRATRLAKIVLTAGMILRIWRSYEKHLRVTIMWNKINFLVDMLKIKLRIRRGKIGTDLPIRQQRLVRNSFTVGVNYMMHQHERSAKYMLRDFFFRTGINTAVISSTISNRERIVKIQQKYRARMVSLRLREESFQLICEREKEIIVGYLLKKLSKNKKDKKLNGLFKRLNSIKPEVLSRILQMFMHRQIYYFTVRFMIWLITHRQYDEETVRCFEQGFIC